jgi:hypothetical protein
MTTFEAIVLLITVISLPVSGVVYWRADRRVKATVPTKEHSTIGPNEKARVTRAYAGAWFLASLLLLSTDLAKIRGGS